jgi:hypothetical protein
MLDRVDKKHDYQTESVDLKFSNFVFNPPINKGNGKEHINLAYFN